ncbi:MAG: nitroreductase [Pseudomonadota bacterium]
MGETAIDLVLRRRSVVAKLLGSPGPDEAALKTILTAGLRAPDHKMLKPWRLIVFEGDARRAFGALLAGITCLERDDLAFDEAALAADAARFERAPCVIAVVSTMKTEKPVPEWEQVLSAGAVCQNLLTAATALGFSAQWITEWAAYSTRAAVALGLEDNEQIAGFIYIGTAAVAPKERARPDLDTCVSRWQPQAR